MKKKVTIEDLAVMTQKGFLAVDKRFDGVDKKFGEIDKRFDEVDKRLDRIENLLIRDHENRLNRIDDDMRVIKTRLKV